MKKTKRRLKKKFIVFLFIYFILFTSYFAFSTLSKYASQVNTSDQVSVARFSVNATGNNANIDMIAGNGGSSLTYTVTITSASEVATNYSIMLTNVPTGVKVKLDNGSYISGTNNEISFNNAGTFAPNDSNSTRTHTLTFMAEIGAATQSNASIGLDVVFTQVQPQNLP